MTSAWSRRSTPYHATRSRKETESVDRQRAHQPRRTVPGLKVKLGLGHIAPAACEVARQHLLIVAEDVDREVPADL